MLKEGDIFNLEAGHVVYLYIPDHFIFGNTIGVFDKLSKTKVKVGSSKPFDLSFLVGEYLVTKAYMDGGGTAQGNDQYPDGWHVTCKKLPPKKKVVDYDNIECSFYQSGSFTAMNPDIKATGRAKATWTRAKDA